MTVSRKEDDKMNVLMINGSPNTKGCTFTALTEIGKTLQEQNINYEIMQLGKQPIRDCINCNRCHGDGCIFDDDMVNEFIQKAKDADGFVFGTPVYYAHPSGRLLSFLDRAFYSSASSRIYKPFQFKPAAAIASARRAGTTASIDVINKYFSIAMMPIVSSTYWNMDCKRCATLEKIWHGCCNVLHVQNNTIFRNLNLMLQTPLILFTKSNHPKILCIDKYHAEDFYIIKLFLVIPRIHFT